MVVAMCSANVDCTNRNETDTQAGYENVHAPCKDLPSACEDVPAQEDTACIPVKQPVLHAAQADEICRNQPLMKVATANIAVDVPYEKEGSMKATVVPRSSRVQLHFLEAEDHHPWRMDPSNPLQNKGKPMHRYLMS
jgi:hypothetical protein